MPDIVTFEAFKERMKGQKSAGRKDGPADIVVRQGFTADIKAIDDAARTVDWIISTDTVDRSSDSIKIEGWKLDNFRKNPVVLFAHDSNSLPVAQATKVGLEGNTLRSTSMFADEETYKFADTVYRLVRGKFLRAVSVGFIPLKYQWADDDSNRFFGMDILEQELLEYSIVPIPCNPEALIAAGMTGIDLTPIRAWAEKILDTGESCVVPRKLLEETFKLAKTPKSVRRQYLREPEKTVASLVVKLDTTDVIAAFESVLTQLKAQAQGEPALGNDDDGDDLEAGMAAPADKEKDEGGEPDEDPGEVDEVTAGKGATAPDGKPANSTDRDGDTGGEDQDVSNAAAKPAGQAAATPAKKDMDSCGLAPDVTCGMADPSKCSIHAPANKDIGGPSDAQTDLNPGIADPPAASTDGGAGGTGGPSGAQTEVNPGVPEDETSSAHPGGDKPVPDGSGGPAKSADAVPAGGIGSGKPDPEAGEPDTAVSEAAAPKTFRLVISDEVAIKFGATEKAPEAPPAEGGIKVNTDVVAGAIARSVAAAIAKALGKAPVA